MEPDRAPFWAQLGQAVKAARTAAGMTQQQLSELCGVTRSSIANTEAGRQALGLYDVIVIARVLPEFTVPGLPIVPAETEDPALTQLQAVNAELTRRNLRLTRRLLTIRRAVFADDRSDAIDEQALADGQ